MLRRTTVLGSYQAHHDVARVRLSGEGMLYAGPAPRSGAVDFVVLAGDATTSPSALEPWVAAWNQAADPPRRLHFLEQAVTADVVYQDPLGDARGRSALLRWIDDFRVRVGASPLTVVGPVRSARGGYAAASWSVGDVPGVDVVHVSGDGHIDRVARFFETHERSSRTSPSECRPSVGVSGN